MSGDALRVWPLVEVEKEEIRKEKGKVEDWRINYLENIELTNKQKLAEVIADQIADWFAGGRVIYSRKDKCARTIRYSDIMILVKNRDRDFINYLIRQFNRRKIPSMGNDKFNLLDNIISQDIISLCKFLLFNEDDLSLANIIKSPFLGMGEGDLYLLCEYKNTNNCSLWKSFKNYCGNGSPNPFPNISKQTGMGSETHSHAYYSKFLIDLIEKKDDLSVYELLFYIFETQKMRRNFKERFPHVGDEVIDEFLSIANEYEKSHNNATLLSFIDFLENTDLSIKRDMEQGSNEIRIITTHSAKGLESPIVILPDTNHGAQTIYKIDKILNFKEDGADYTIPILQKEKSNAIEKIKTKMKVETEEEYLRLLYVAITRAENELYVFDYKRKGEPNENSWYNILKQAVLAMGGKTRENGVLYVGDDIKFGEKCEVLSTKNEDVGVNDLIKTLSIHRQKANEIKIINPSNYYAENVVKNPGENLENLERGRLVHKLLELLPNADKSEWNDIIDIYLKGKSPEVRDIVLGVLNNEKFNFMFGENSKAEVPIFGKVGDDIISGQIDRLAIVGDVVYIIDYKNTNFLPAKIPQKYVKQLELYREVLGKIYGDKRIECYVLWTGFGENK